MRDVVIAGACRTAIGTFGGGLKGFSAIQLGTVVIQEAVKRAGVRPEAVDEVIMGHVLQAGLGENPARQCSVNAGVPIEVPAFTVNKVCGSGLKAVALGAAAIAAGDADIVVAGGMESMTNAPYLVAKARWGVRMGNEAFVDSMLHDGLLDPWTGVHMGITAENVMGTLRPAFKNDGTVTAGNASGINDGAAAV